jgi:uncharacterized integral membrane protein (TIGR00697 family)
MNELLFFCQIIVLCSFLLMSLKLGKVCLFIFTSIQPLFCNLFVFKQITLFSMNVSAAEAYAVTGILGMNLLREYFGRKEAMKAIYFSFLNLFLFTVMSQFQLKFVPNPSDWGHDSYCQLFCTTPRIVLCSFISFFLSERLDLAIFSFLKDRFTFGNVTFRYVTSTCISQIFDTAFITFFGFYGILDNLVQLMIFSYMVKVLVIFSSSIFAQASKFFAPKHE